MLMDLKSNTILIALESPPPIRVWSPAGVYLSPVSNALWKASINVEPVKLDARPPQTQLLTKTPSQSRTTIFYNFSSDYILREQYKDPWNEVRIGKLPEDLDALACTISVKGSAIDSSESLAVTANFTFVELDCHTGKAVPVNRVLPETDRENSLFKQAEARNQARKLRKILHLREDNCGINNRVEASSVADRNRGMSSVVLRDSTGLENWLLCEPHHKNMHGKVFGRYLMHRAFELAFSTAYTFAALLPVFLEVDHVEFLRPVDVGDLVHFKSGVVYTKVENNPDHDHDQHQDQPLIHVEVVARVTRPEQSSAEVSNKFYFSFSVRPETKKLMKKKYRIKNVIPSTELSPSLSFDPFPAVTP